jgi:hypothetical protein
MEMSLATPFCDYFFQAEIPNWKPTFTSLKGRVWGWHLDWEAMRSLLLRIVRRDLVTPAINQIPGPSLEDIRPQSAHQHHATATEVVGAVYQWMACLFISVLVLAQLFGAVWHTTTTVRHYDYGRDPSLELFQIVGTNDLPYADRVIACVRYGRKYEPRLVSSLLAAPGLEAIVEDVSGEARHGFRVVKRKEGSTSDQLDSAVSPSYRAVCGLIAATLDNILDACSELGYANLESGDLRVAEGSNLVRLADSLPVLIMPFWDNALGGRHAVPTRDGDACMFRLGNAYKGGATTKASFYGVNRTVRHERTLQWLKPSSGEWRNGWFEDSEGGRWFSEVSSSNPAAPYFMPYRMFDMSLGLEVNCSTQADCLQEPTTYHWGPKFVTYEYIQDMSSVTILNGSSFGHFLYEVNQETTVRILYDWETLVANLSVVMVLIRWILALLVLHVSAVRGKNPFLGGGIGCVADSRTFDLLVISMLPQLRMLLAAFWTVGCRFEGQQAGLSEAWFTIYPGIAQLMLMYFSLLNSLAKITRRRMSDALFAPSIAFLCLMHFFRSDLAASNLLQDVDGRVTTLVFSDEVKSMKLHDFFISDLAWRLNGRVTVLFHAKLAVLAVNLVPLVMARSFPVAGRESKSNLHGVELALGLKVNHVGGLGRSPVYLRVTEGGEVTSVRECRSPVSPQPGSTKPTASHPTRYLNSYELIRLGYIVFGDRYLISFDDWDVLSSMAPLRSCYHLWNQRVCVWTLQEVTATDNRNGEGLRVLQRRDPEMWRLDDKRLQSLPWWQISSRAIQC